MSDSVKVWVIGFFFENEQGHMGFEVELSSKPTVGEILKIARFVGIGGKDAGSDGYAWKIGKVTQVIHNVWVDGPFKHIRLEVLVNPHF